MSEISNLHILAQMREVESSEFNAAEGHISMAEHRERCANHAPAIIAFARRLLKVVRAARPVLQGVAYVTSGEDSPPVSIPDYMQRDCCALEDLLRALKRDYLGVLEDKRDG